MPGSSGILVVGGALGGVVGFVLAAMIYTTVNPVLENSTSWVRELQGMLWNVVPLGTGAGAVIGVLIARWRR